MRAILRRVALVALALVVGTTASVFVAMPAEAKTNTVILNGSDWLGGNGVDVYSNDGSYDSGGNDTNYYNNVQTGLRWQCVELINRLYLTRGWTTTWWSGNGYEMYDTARSLGLKEETNGSINSVNPGDVIVLGGGWMGLGHVAVVDSVNGTTIHTVSQNLMGSNPRRDFTWDQNAKTINSGWSGYTTTGIVHAPYGATITPASPHMYQPISYSFRFRNTSGDDMWIKRLVIAVRSPGGTALDITCAESLILGVNQEWTCNLSLQQGYGQQGTYQYWADWMDWDDAWHTGDLGNIKTFTVGPPYTLTAVQPISVGPSGIVTMYTPVNYSYRVRNTSGVAASIQRLIVAVRTAGGGNLDTNCNNGMGVSLQPNQEWTCSFSLAQGYGAADTYTFWADWQDFNNNWHAGELGSTTATKLTVTQAPTLTVTGSLSVGPSSSLAMYQPAYWSYRVKNTSGSYTSIQRLIVAVRTPSGGNIDVNCDGGTNLTLAPAEEWTCAAHNNDGYGSQGTFTFWADWQGFDDAWHKGNLSGTLTMNVGPPQTLTTIQGIDISPGNNVPKLTPLHWSYTVRNTSNAAVSVREFLVAVIGPAGDGLNVGCTNGAAVTLQPNQTWTCQADLPTGYGSTGQFRYRADWQDNNLVWHTGMLGPQYVVTLY